MEEQQLQALQRLMMEAIMAAYKKGLLAGYEAATDGKNISDLPAISILFIEGVRDSLTPDPRAITLQ